MNKKTDIALNWIKYSFMIAIVILSIYIFFFETENFCVETGGQVEFEDSGKKCFKTIKESNEYKLYLIDKYDLDKKPELNFTISE